MAEAARALAALHASLANDGARDAYWAAFSRFMRFEITKAEFDKLALAALGRPFAQELLTRIHANDWSAVAKTATPLAYAKRPTPKATERCTTCSTQRPQVCTRGWSRRHSQGPCPAGHWWSC